MNYLDYSMKTISLIFPFILSLDSQKAATKTN